MAPTLDHHSAEEPVPAVMADSLGGVCRKGWQYFLVGAAPHPLDGVDVREGWTEADHPEAFG
jgi:hypothetical protein